MGRSKIEGNEVCPKCGKIGRFRPVRTRNGEYKNARAREYLRFKHNDSTLKECNGIEKAFREKELEIIRNGPNPVMGEELFLLSEPLLELINKLEVASENIRQTNIDPKDDKKYALMFKEGSRYYGDAMLALKKYIELIIKPNKTPAELQAINKFSNIMDNIEKQQQENIKLYHENPKEYLRFLKRTLKKDKMFWSLHLWFEKYEGPKRAKARKELSGKLSESAFGSSKYNADYIVNRTD